MFFVTDWETRKVIREFEKLGVAKRWCRGIGHTGHDDPGATGYPPIAYVANERGKVVYNPRFGKKISSSVSGIVNSNDDYLRG